MALKGLHFEKPNQSRLDYLRGGAQHAIEHTKAAWLPPRQAAAVFFLSFLIESRMPAKASGSHFMQRHLHGPSIACKMIKEKSPGSPGQHDISLTVKYFTMARAIPAEAPQYNAIADYAVHGRGCRTGPFESQTPALPASSDDGQI